MYIKRLEKFLFLLTPNENESGRQACGDINGERREKKKQNIQCQGLVCRVCLQTVKVTQFSVRFIVVLCCEPSMPLIDDFDVFRFRLELHNRETSFAFFV
jgi:hypothetical protein